MTWEPGLDVHEWESEWASLEDGSPLTDLRGFRVYYGVDQTSLTSRLEIPSADVTSATIEALEPATWYFAVRAYTTDGAESGSSNVVSKTIN